MTATRISDSALPVNATTRPSTKRLNNAERVFKMGAIELADIAPDLEPAVKSMRLHAAQYPHLKRAMLSEPRVEGSRVVYEVEMQPAKTKA